MKTILLGFCALLTFQCFAQTGNFSLQLTQNTDFELSCGAYNGIAGGMQVALKLSPKFKASTGFNLGSKGANGSYVYEKETSANSGQVVSIGWVGKGNIPNLDIPLTLHYQFLQKEKFALQMNLGMRQKFALQRTETKVPEFNQVDFSDHRAVFISTNMDIGNDIFNPMMFPEMPDFEPINHNVVLVEEKGYDGFDAFVGLGANYQFSSFWSLGLNTNFDFFGLNKQAQIVDDVQENWTDKSFKMGNMRLGLSLVRQF